MTGASQAQLRAFARRGHVVFPQVVPPGRVAAALREIDRLIAREPPPAPVRAALANPA